MPTRAIREVSALTPGQPAKVHQPDNRPGNKPRTPPKKQRGKKAR